jgi:hypothetical protein
MLPNGHYSGDAVEVSGIYRSVHYAHRWDDVEHVFIRGQQFPWCSRCHDCEFILVKAAPSAAEIPEFSGQTTNGKVAEKARVQNSTATAIQGSGVPKKKNDKLSPPAA